MLTVLGSAVAGAFEPMVICYTLLGVTLGVTVGAIPGLSGDMAIAILLPLVYKVEPTISLGLLIGIYKGSMFGGSISAISFGVPGTPAAAATVEDGYPLAKKGHPMQAMMQALASSVTGDSISSLLLVFLTIPMGKLALQFGPVEFFALYVFSLIIIAALTRDSPLKGILGAILGLLIGCIGMDPVTGATRMTFGIESLRGGFSTVPLLIGVFAISELIIQYANTRKERLLRRLGQIGKEPGVIKSYDRAHDRYTLGHYLATFKATIIGSLIGTFVGILPGAGSSLASYISYGTAKNICKDGKSFGSGVLNGVAAPEAGNSATCGASIIPLLAFGIPGSATAALIGSALMMQGINPGPTMMAENQGIIYTFFVVVLYASVMNFGISRCLIPLYARISRIQQKYLIPIIFVLAILGIYTTSNSAVHVWMMLAAGLLGVMLRFFRIPLGPFILGFIIGPSAERSLRQALLLGAGDWKTLFGTPIAIGFYLVTILSILFIAFLFRSTGESLDKGAFSDDE